jgi:hypothetical protein
MSIDFIVRDKIQDLLNQTQSLTSGEDLAPYMDKVEELHEFCKENYNGLCEYIELMQHNKVSDNKHQEVLEKYKGETDLLKDNLKRLLELFISLSKFEGPYQEQLDWLNELKKLDN